MYFRNSGNLLELASSNFIFLISMKYKYTCCCPLILSTLLLSLKGRYLLENQIGLLIFLSEFTVLVITYCHITAFTPAVDLSAVRQLLTVGRLFVAVSQAFEIVVPSVCIKNCHSILWNNQKMQLYAVKFIPLLGSLYMFRVFYTPIIRSTIFNCI